MVEQNHMSSYNMDLVRVMVIEDGLFLFSWTWWTYQHFFDQYSKRSKDKS